MQTRTILAAGLALVAIGCAQDARAGARFETGEEAPVTAAVRLDFTIVIPQILTLTISSDPAASPAPAIRTDMVVAHLVPLTSAVPADPALLANAHASTNAGTLAGGMTGPQAPQTGLLAAGLSAEQTVKIGAPGPGPAATVSLDTQPAIYLVALP